MPVFRSFPSLRAPSQRDIETGPPGVQGGAIDNSLGPLAAGGATPDQVADAAVSVWRAVHAALSPVIGAAGVAALYKRTLHLQREDRPWLDDAYYGAVKPGDFTSLRSSLSRQDSVIAAGAHDAMIRSLVGLLSELIGPSLTQRLLQPVWPSPTAGNPMQDLSP